jgi:hypothetical protein
LPCSRSRATPPLNAQQLHVPTVRLEERAHLLQGADHPLLHRHGVQAVEQQQVSNHRIPRQDVQHPYIALRNDPQQARQPIAMELQQRLQQLCDGGPYIRRLPGLNLID